MPNQFFAEGNDIKFITDILTVRNKSNQNDIFVQTNGWTNLHLVKSKFLENANKGGANYVFFDADGNALQRRRELLQVGNDLGIQFELFLFPNNVDSGTIESLLLQIILPRYNDIFRCFENYIQCVSNSNANYLLPDLKSKFFAFTEATSQDANLKKINFNNSGFYDLNNAALNALYNFIDLHL